MPRAATPTEGQGTTIVTAADRPIALRSGQQSLDRRSAQVEPTPTARRLERQERLLFAQVTRATDGTSTAMETAWVASDSRRLRVPNSTLRTG